MKPLSRNSKNYAALKSAIYYKKTSSLEKILTSSARGGIAIIQSAYQIALDNDNTLISDMFLTDVERQLREREERFGDKAYPMSAKQAEIVAEKLIEYVGPTF